MTITTDMPGRRCCNWMGSASMKTILAALLFCALPLAARAAEIARFDSFDYTGHDATAAAPLPAGQYQNPILGGFYSDPSMVGVGDDYYLVSSTFCWFPGIPVFHSRDLVHWTQIGNAIDRPGMLNFDSLGLSRGVFAPDIRRHLLYRQYLRGLRRQLYHHGEESRWAVVRSGLAQGCRRH
jgi:hypothetical protein